jgi:hypothetical protein
MARASVSRAWALRRSRLALHQGQVAQLCGQAEHIRGAPKNGDGVLQVNPGGVQLSQVHADQAHHREHAGEVVRVGQAAAHPSAPVEQLERLVASTLSTQQNRLHPQRTNQQRAQLVTVRELHGLVRPGPGDVVATAGQLQAGQGDPYAHPGRRVGGQLHGLHEQLQRLGVASQAHPALRARQRQPRLHQLGCQRIQVVQVVAQLDHLVQRSSQAPGGVVVQLQGAEQALSQVVALVDLTGVQLEGPRSDEVGHRLVAAQLGVALQVGHPGAMNEGGVGLVRGSTSHHRVQGQTVLAPHQQAPFGEQGEVYPGLLDARSRQHRDGVIQGEASEHRAGAEHRPHRGREAAPRLLEVRVGGAGAHVEHLLARHIQRRRGGHQQPQRGRPRQPLGHAGGEGLGALHVVEDQQHGPPRQGFAHHPGGLGVSQPQRARDPLQHGRPVRAAQVDGADFDPGQTRFGLDDVALSDARGAHHRAHPGVPVRAKPGALLGPAHHRSGVGLHDRRGGGKDHTVGQIRLRRRAQAVQDLPELLSVGPAVQRVGLQAAIQHASRPGQHAVQPTPQGLDVRVGLLQRLDGLFQSGQLPQPVPQQDLDQQRAEGEDVAGRPRRHAHGLFGGHVVEGAPAATLPGARRGGDAEVHQAHAAAVVHQHVVRLEVAVDDVALVQRSQSGGDLQQEVQTGRRGQGAAHQQLAQGQPLNALHGEVGDALDLAHIQHIDHVGMAHAGRQPGLANQLVRLHCDIVLDHLDRDGLLQRQGAKRVPLEHTSHAALAQQTGQAVGAEFTGQVHAPGYVRVLRFPRC